MPTRAPSCRWSTICGNASGKPATIRRGDIPTKAIGRQRLDEALGEGAPEASLIHGAAEEFARRLAAVIRRFAMRIAVLADVHGNSLALEAVFAGSD